MVQELRWVPHTTPSGAIPLGMSSSLKLLGQPILVLGDGANSNLILSLKGQPPFGSGPDAEFPRMPVGFDAVPDDSIRSIEQWINNGCPDGVGRRRNYIAGRRTRSLICHVINHGVGHTRPIRADPTSSRGRTISR